jgi:hypothetical protein
MDKSIIKNGYKIINLYTYTYILNTIDYDWNRVGNVIYYNY